jgi:hypothetical protein
MEARIRPFAVNKVEMRLRPRGGGTRVRMIEYPTGGLAKLLPSPLTDMMLHVRNAEALRRLRRLAEDGRTRA